MVLLTGMVAPAGPAVFGRAHLLTGRSTLARSVAWMESDIGDRHRFPARPVPRAGAVRPLPRAREDPDVAAAVPDGSLSGVELDDFLARHATRAFLVVHRGRLVYERYFNGGSPTRTETSFPMAKSVTSTLVGIAIDEGVIGSVEDPVTR